MPTFDIIIPAYNAARFLPAALDSVIAQTFPDWRILLVDDGSTDHTPEVLAPYREKLGDRLRYIRQPNGGLPAARNTAVRHATAEFLAILDADDEWLPQRLAKTLERFRQDPEVGLTYGFVARTDIEGKIVQVFDRPHRHAEGWVAPFLYMRQLNLPCPTVTVRRACIEEVGLFDETLRATEDRDLWLRIALKYKVGLIPEVIANYRMSPDAMTRDGNRMLKAQLQFIAKHYGKPGCGWRARRVALGWVYRQRAEAFADGGSLRPALASALRAFRMYPIDLKNIRTLLSLILRSYPSARVG